MKERIEKLIDALVKQRDGLLNEYLGILEDYSVTGPKASGLQCAESAGFIHDIDRHITNLHMELRSGEFIHVR